MSLATSPPIRRDLALLSNNDTAVGVVWLAGDAETPVVPTEATLTLRFDPPPLAAGEPVPDPIPEPVLLTIDATDETGWPEGRIMFTIPAGTDVGTGVWDAVAVSTDGTHRCLMRGEFYVEEGIT